MARLNAWVVAACVMAWSGCGSDDTATPVDADAGGHPSDSGTDVVDADVSDTGPGPDVDDAAADSTDGESGTTGACTLPEGPVLSVESFGAVGDGTTDDTDALRAAFADAASKHAVLRFAPGKTYEISGTLQLKDVSDVAIDGNGATLFMADGTPTTNHKLLSLINCTKCRVSNLTLDGNRAGRVPHEGAGAHAIGVSGGSDFAFCKVIAKNSTCDGFYISALDKTAPATFARRGLFQDCGADNSYRQGMSIINASDIQIIGGAYTNTNGTLPEAGIDLEPNDGSANPGVAHVLVRGVRFEGNNGTGMTGGGAVTISNVTVEDSLFVNNGLKGGTGFRVGYMHSLVQNNVFTGHGPAVTNQTLVFRGSADTHHVVVRNNTFKDNSSTARVVEIAYTGPETYFVDNVFTNNGGPSIHTHSVTTTCISGNSTDGKLDSPAGTCGPLPTVGYAP